MPDKTEKKRRLLYRNPDSGFGWMVLDPEDRIIAQAIRADLLDDEGVDDGEVITFEFKKVMMSDEEIEKLPDI